jgi:hypothetical protein
MYTAANLLHRERSIFGMDHCEAGGWLAGNWGLPGVIGQAAATHHEAPSPGCLRIPRSHPVRRSSLGIDRVRRGAARPGLLHYRDSSDPDPVVLAARITSRLDSFDQLKAPERAPVS